MMNEAKWPLLFLMSFIVILGLATGMTEVPKVFAQEEDPRAFRILKEKSIDPRTGLPRTLDPGLFKGRAKAAYTIAKEIPDILAQMPCFCECEAYGHENLLDCFIDKHGAG
jgi:hypothetical protein